MKDFFQKRSGAGAANPSSGPRLTLAAFGKHPGWDDHIPGIGLETETLVAVERSLYDVGIRGQIDSGAWQNLEPEKRLAGFDHLFLWSRDGHTLLGQFWSSTDGKGRLNYPMVLCIDGEAVPATFLLGVLRPGLDRLRDACQSLTTADQVLANCHMAQEQLRAMLDQIAARAEDSVPPLDVRRRFLLHRELGPGRQGLLRILHELISIPGLQVSSRTPTSAGRATVSSRHLRVPIAADSRGQALLLWSAFLRCRVPEHIPLLLLARRETPWLDVILGEPVTDDFFCLQASTNALPLATEIPYDITPEVKASLQELEARFLAEQPGSPALAIASTAKLAPAAHDTVPPVIASAPGPDTKPRNRFFFTLVAVPLLAVVAIAWFLFLNPTERKPKPTPLTPGVTDTASASDGKSSTASVTAGASEVELAKKYSDATNASLAAFVQKDYQEAARQANLALSIKANDLAAAKLRDDSQRALAAQAAREQQYAVTLRAAQAALIDGNFSQAVTHAEAALALKPDDSEAVNVKTSAQRQLRLAAESGAGEEKYKAAIKQAQAALATSNYSEALAKAQVALGLKPGDPAATEIRDNANRSLQQLIEAKSREDRFQSAMASAQSALNAKDYASAVTQAGIALRIKPDDATAKKLRENADLAFNLARQATVAEQPVTKTAQPVLVASTSQTTPVTRAQKPSAGKGTSFTNGLGMEFVWLPALANGGAWLGRHEVTRKQFHTLIPSGTPVPLEENNLPVSGVSFEDAKRFCDLLSQREGQHYVLPSREQWLGATGLTAEQVAAAWSMVSTQGLLAQEVTSYKLNLPLTRPARVGSKGPQTNGVCDMFGNVREWLVNSESAGFSFDTQGYGQRKLLFVDGTGFKDNPITGFRCLLQEAK